MPALALTSVAVHPLVLLSVIDHYNRVCRDTNKRAVGVLLGQIVKGKVSCTNSFAVPFEEDDKDSSVWFLDHNYLENMMSMFRKVNARERVVGWYSTGPKIHSGDLDINELIRNYCAAPVLVIVDVKPRDLGLPTEAYISIEEADEKDGAITKTFEHLPSEIDATDAEEVGVGHLLRDIQDSSVSNLTNDISAKVAALMSLGSRLSELQEYLFNVSNGDLPINHEIMYRMQDVFNLLPTLNMPHLGKGFLTKTNDIMLVLYVSALIRTIIALHNLVDNKIMLKNDEKMAAEKAADKRDGGKVDKSDKKENISADANSTTSTTPKKPSSS